MTNPFPGMDPFLEGYIWPDVHQSLSFCLKELLVPLIAPTYVARMSFYTVRELASNEDIGIMYPDVDIIQHKNKLEEEAIPYTNNSTPPITPISISFSAFETLEVKIPVLEIRDREKNELITAIEILSPVNKRNPGLKAYRKKRKRLYQSGVHLLEIDLIRRGIRPIEHPLLPNSHYIVSLLRAGSGKDNIWAIDLKDALPVVPVPLRAPDPDVPLDIGAALNLSYSRSQYQLSVDYTKSPPFPQLSSGEATWMRALLQQQLT